MEQEKSWLVNKYVIFQTSVVGHFLIRGLIIARENPDWYIIEVIPHEIDKGENQIKMVSLETLASAIVFDNYSKMERIYNEMTQTIDNLKAEDAAKSRRNRMVRPPVVQ